MAATVNENAGLPLCTPEQTQIIQRNNPKVHSFGKGKARKQFASRHVMEIQRLVYFESMRAVIGSSSLCYMDVIRLQPHIHRAH